MEIFISHFARYCCWDNIDVWIRNVAVLLLLLTTKELIDLLLLRETLLSRSSRSIKAFCLRRADSLSKPVHHTCQTLIEQGSIIIAELANMSPKFLTVELICFLEGDSSGRPAISSLPPAILPIAGRTPGGNPFPPEKCFSIDGQISLETSRCARLLIGLQKQDV